LEEQKKMAYVTSFERLGMKKGRKAGRQEGRQEGQQVASDIMLRFLRQKFGDKLLPEIEQQINTLTLEQLKDLTDNSLNFSTNADLEVWLQQQKRPAPEN
jgi:predicted transposase YdaD